MSTIKYCDRCGIELKDGEQSGHVMGIDDADATVSEADLLAAFERIHPMYRTLQFDAKGGKAAHWLTLNTVPEDPTKELSIPLVHLELGHGSADALANFFLTAMAYARQQLEKSRT